MRTNEAAFVLAHPVLTHSQHLEPCGQSLRSGARDVRGLVINTAAWHASQAAWEANRASNF